MGLSDISGRHYDVCYSKPPCGQTQLPKLWDWGQNCGTPSWCLPVCELFRWQPGPFLGLCYLWHSPPCIQAGFETLGEKKIDETNWLGIDVTIYLHSSGTIPEVLACYYSHLTVHLTVKLTQQALRLRSKLWYARLMSTSLYGVQRRAMILIDLELLDLRSDLD